MGSRRVENILDLPNEILHQILLFVPKRYDVALVCRKMYENVCSVEFNKCILKTVLSAAGEQKFKDEILPSIMNTQRKFDEIKLLLPNLMITKQILFKFGENIKKVMFMIKLELSLVEFTELIALMPNLQQIRFDGIDFGLDTLSTESDFIPPVLNLTKLRSINITSENKLELFAKALPTNILEELLIDYYFIDDLEELLLEELLKKQATIHKLHLPSCYPSIAIMKQLKLSDLRYSVQHPDWQKMNDYLKNLLECQPNLVNLNLMNYRDSMFAVLPVNSEIMKVICKMENLERLITNIDEIQIDAVPYFLNLKKLKYLQIMTYSQYASLPVLDKLSLLAIPIHTFYSEIWYFEIPAQTYEQMGKNFKNLKHLRISHNSIHKINFFLENFPNLESLNLCYRYTTVGTTFLNTFDVYTDNRTFPNLKSIKLYITNSKAHSNQNHIDMLKRMLPNVTKFSLKENVSY